MSTFPLYNSGAYVGTCVVCGSPVGALAGANAPLKRLYFNHIGPVETNPDNDVVRAPVWRDLDLDHQAVPS